MENEKIEALEKKLKINKILHIVSISISALAIVLSIVALSGNFVGRGNNRHMMRNGGMRQERMMMEREGDDFNCRGRFFMQNNGGGESRNNKFSSSRMNPNDKNDNRPNRNNKNSKGNNYRFRKDNNKPSSNDNNVPQNNNTPNVERNNQPMAPNINNQIVPQ